MSQWVQHISGKGEKWEVVKDNTSIGWMREGCEPQREFEWCVYVDRSGMKLPAHLLPKSEYRLCDPPEEWEDVTGTVEESPTPGNYKCGHIDIVGVTGAGKDYRLTKMLLEHGPTATQRWAFIVERRKS